MSSPAHFGDAEHQVRQRAQRNQTDGSAAISVVRRRSSCSQRQPHSGHRGECRDGPQRPVSEAEPPLVAAHRGGDEVRLIKDPLWVTAYSRDRTVAAARFSRQRSVAGCRHREDGRLFRTVVADRRCRAADAVSSAWSNSSCNATTSSAAKGPASVCTSAAITGATRMSWRKPQRHSRSARRTYALPVALHRARLGFDRYRANEAGVVVVAHGHG